MGGNMPDGGAAHAEAAHQQSIVVNRILPADGGEGFKQVDLAGELVGVAVAAVEVKNDRVAGRELTGLRHPFAEEIHLAQLFGAPVEPGIDSPAPREARIVGRRNHQPVGLHRTVDLGDITADHEPGGGCPWCLAVLQLIGALLPLGQENLRLGDIGRVEELVIRERVVDGVAEDLDIGQQRIRVQRLDGLGKAGQARLEFFAIRFGYCDSGRRDGAVLLPRIQRRSCDQGDP